MTPHICQFHISDAPGSVDYMVTWDAVSRKIGKRSAFPLVRVLVGVVRP